MGHLSTSAGTPGIPKFASNIYLVNRENFVRLRDKLTPTTEDELNADVPWSIWNRVRLQPKGHTEGAGDCNAGGMTNGQQVCLFHLYPKSAPLTMIRQELGRDISDLKTGKKPVRGLLTGGWAFPSEKTDESKALCWTLLAAMQENGLGGAITTLWGRKSPLVNGYTDVLYNAANDSWYLHVGRKRGEKPVLPLPPLPGPLKGVFGWVSDQVFGKPLPEGAALNLNDLKDTFEVVDIAEGDTLVTPEDPGYRKQLERVLSG